MKYIWKIKYCTDCFFRVERKCRRFPPKGRVVFENSIYPDVINHLATSINDNQHINACAEWEDAQ